MTAALTTTCGCKKAHPLADPTAGRTLCGADTKQAEAKYPSCHRPSGWGTDHAGVGKCKLHGGSSLVYSGRFSTIKDVTLRELIAKHEQDPDPLNILPELAAARALFVDFINRYSVVTAALLAWHESYTATYLPLSEEREMAFEAVLDEWEIALRDAQEPTERQLANLQDARGFLRQLRVNRVIADGKPRQILDISDAYRIVSEITKIVERIEKIRAANAISRSEMTRLIDQMGKVVMMHVDDPAKLKSIRQGWLSLATV